MGKNLSHLPLAMATGLAILLAAVTAAPAGTVGSIQDGDTFCICGKDGFVGRFALRSKTCASTCVGVRICGIDASERGQAGYGEAKRKLAALTDGKAVRCVAVGGGTPCDRRSQLMNQGRVVAQCFVDDRDIARDLVDGGYACDWTNFSGGHYSRNGVGQACPEGHRGLPERSRTGK
jgi:endonuclease YncB( thermonuclease family)